MERMTASLSGLFWQKSPDFQTGFWLIPGNSRGKKTKIFAYLISFFKSLFVWIYLVTEKNHDFNGVKWHTGLQISYSKCLFYGFVANQTQFLANWATSKQQKKGLFKALLKHASLPVDYNSGIFLCQDMKCQVSCNFKWLWVLFQDFKYHLKSSPPSGCLWQSWPIRGLRMCHMIWGLSLRPGWPIE